MKINKKKDQKYKNKKIKMLLFVTNYAEFVTLQCLPFGGLGKQLLHEIDIKVKPLPQIHLKLLIELFDENLAENIALYKYW